MANTYQNICGVIALIIHYIFRLTPAWPKSAPLSYNVMGSSLVGLQAGVFEKFGEVKFSVIGPPTEQIQALLKTLALPDDRLVRLGKNPFADIQPDAMVFIFEAPAYLDETAVLEIMRMLSQNRENTYHLETGNGRELQIYVLNGESAQTFSASKTIKLPLRDMIPVDTPLDFHNLSEHIRKSIIIKHVENGIVIKNPCTVSIDGDVILDRGVIIEPGTILRGHTKIGRGSLIGPDTVIESCKIGNNCTIVNSTINLSTLDNNVRVGPYAHILPGCRLCNDTVVGSFVELKNVRIDEGSLVTQLSYIGDAEVGKNVNIGGGVVTANFNGVSKHMTQVEDNAFIGCNSVLIAPVSIGEGSVVSAGSTITNDVPPHALATARSRQKNKEEWALDRTRNL
jgi:bifunctional UDP-N-acetylglucosamine pyrophosphorylase/glucosamine-1-phosphate N-acetyltransferase